MSSQSLLSLSNLEFPYDQARFPGQATDEKILYVTREHRLFLWLRLLFVVLVSSSVLLAAFLLAKALQQIVPNFNSNALSSVALIIFLAILLLGGWWIFSVWKKSVAILTNKRLTKFIYTTPINRYNLSLPLEMIVDTSCHNKGFLSSYLHLGTVTARSSATSSGVATDDRNRINKKYFYLENIEYFEDFQQYLNKVISVLRQDVNKLTDFRPFLPKLKGEQRQAFLRNNYPEYSNKKS